MHLLQALRLYVIQLRADGRAVSTIAQYERHIRLLDQWLAARRKPRTVAKVSHETLAMFLTSDEARRRPDGVPKKETATNTLRSSLRTFFGYVHAAGMTPGNPARLIRRARCAPPPPRALNDRDVRRLLRTVAAGKGPAAVRDRALIGLLVGTGLRLSSALALRVEDVDLRRGDVRVTRTKNDRPLLLPLSRAVVRELGAYLRTRNGPLLFPGSGGRPLTRRQAGRRIEGWAAAAGLTGKASAHVLRHVFATRLYRRTGDLLITQAALGHASVASTTIYARTDRAALRAALR